MNTADENDPATTEETTEEPREGAETTADAVGADEEASQVLLVRRRRTPALGFWVLLALAVAFLGGAVVAWIADVRTPAGMLYLGVTAAVMVGLPLAALAAGADAIAERCRRRRDAAGRGAGHDRGRSAGA